MSDPLFPIQATCTYSGNQVLIPWADAEEIYKEYAAKYGTSQSLDRLRERHGFGAAEAIMLLCQRIRRLQSQPAKDMGGVATTPTDQSKQR